MSPRTRILAICLLLFAANAYAQALDRVDTRVAMAQVIKKVDPVYPPEAASAHVGGLVVADVTVSAAGRVTKVAIIAGDDLLHAAATAALQQWTFKPFIVRGQARPVIVIIDVNFPDPVKEQDDRNYEALRAATYECERQFED